MGEREGKRPQVVVKQLKSQIRSVKTLPKGPRIMTETKKREKVSESRT